MAESLGIIPTARRPLKYTGSDSPKYPPRLRVRAAYTCVRVANTCVRAADTCVRDEYKRTHLADTSIHLSLIS